MAGHSHWAGIKHKKEATDEKRGKLFSKLLAAITAAARGDPNPDFNPRLRTAIEKAREHNVPSAHIERAAARARESGGALEELLFEAYGPGGAALLIEATSDNKNRTIAEVKKILSAHGAKWAEGGSVRWAFEAQGGGWRAKFPHSVGEHEGEQLAELLAALEDHSDVQKVFTNVS